MYHSPHPASRIPRALAMHMHPRIEIAIIKYLCTNRAGFHIIDSRTECVCFTWTRAALVQVKIRIETWWLAWRRVWDTVPIIVVLPRDARTSHSVREERSALGSGRGCGFPGTARRVVVWIPGYETARKSKTMSSTTSCSHTQQKNRRHIFVA